MRVAQVSQHGRAKLHFFLNKKGNFSSKGQVRKDQNNSCPRDTIILRYSRDSLKPVTTKLPRYNFLRFLTIEDQAKA